MDEKILTCFKGARHRMYMGACFNCGLTKRALVEAQREHHNQHQNELRAKRKQKAYVAKKD